ncbi:MAG: hypothetical protein ACRDRJ_48365 [Streptosporangiaceae bacterium]
MTGPAPAHPPGRDYLASRVFRHPYAGNELRADQDAGRHARRKDLVMLTSDQLAAITGLSDEWSFLWDKRRQLWIAAQDSPDGEQLEEADLDALIARIGQLPG